MDALKISRFLLFLVLLPAPAFSQTQWHLENYLTRTGTVHGEMLGQQVKGVGDYDHDGKIEVAVADWPYTDIWSITSNTDSLPKTRFRGVVLEKGDINGDGYQDFVIGKPGWIGGGIDTVFVYFGDSTGIDTIADDTLTSEFEDDKLGSNIAIGDINGDGIQDLVITAPDYPALYDRGRVYIYFGRRHFVTTPDLVMTGDTTRAGLGEDCRIADVNSDGFADLVLTGRDGRQVSNDSTWFNYLNVYYGGPGFDTLYEFRLQGQRGLYYGGAVELMDANGDGRTDILWTHEIPGSPYNRINLNIYYGGPSLGTSPNLAIPEPKDLGMSFDLPALINAGDMDGDGYDDTAISDPIYAQTGGIVVVYRGGPRIDTVWDAAAGQVREGQFGEAIARIGDINGDGLSDIIIGEPRYEFGSQVGAFSIYIGDRRINDVKSEKKSDLPRIASLDQNYPNPFNPETKISYSLFRRGKVSLKIVDILGQAVTTLADIAEESGTHSVSWSGSGHAAGVYFYQLTVSTPDGVLFTDTKKLMLLP